jgi:multisubunit Na+/H+ antiporter MnhG subunit
MPKRTEPLSAPPRASIEGVSLAPPPDQGDSGRFARLSDGVTRLRTGGTLKLGERTLMVLGGILAPLGLVFVILGWYGAAHHPNQYEQIPYMISGGLLGVGLVFLGSFFYFTHWLTELVKEHRAQSAALLEAINRLDDTVRREAGNDRTANGHSPSATAGDVAAWGPDVVLVATGKGTMAHRPECVVVAGKPGLRTVTADEALAPCKLCDPYATDLALN